MRPISLWIEPVPKYVIEITLARIEYVKVRRRTTGRFRRTQADLTALFHKQVPA
jgi:hypothetical protein